MSTHFEEQQKSLGKMMNHLSRLNVGLLQTGLEQIEFFRAMNGRTPTVDT